MEKIPAKNIVDKIKNEKIMPQSHMRVHWKNYLFWSAWVLIMLFGAISFSLLIPNLLDVRPEFLFRLGIGQYVRILMMTAPYLWLILLVIAFGTGYLAMRRTRKGYRLSIIFISSVIVLIIALLGTVLHLSKFNQHVEKRMLRNAHFSDVTFPAHNRWSRPRDGMMAGEVVDVSTDQIMIVNLNDEEWIVTYDHKTKFDFLEELHSGMFAEFIGKKTGEQSFYAEFVRPLPSHLKNRRTRAPSLTVPLPDEINENVL